MKRGTKTPLLIIFSMLLFCIAASFVSAEVLTVCAVDCNSTTIQGAIDSASSGDTINIDAGTYVEKLVISKTLTLNCSASYATMIQNNETPVAGVYDVEIDANNTIIQNCLFDFNGDDDTRGGLGVVVSDMNDPPVTGVQILDNILYTGDGSGAGGTAISTGKYSDVSGLVVQGNIFYGDLTGMGEGVYVNPHNGTGSVLIRDNQFYGYLFSGVSVEAGNVDVINNTVNSNATLGMYGLRLIDLTGGQSFSGVTMSSNDVRNVQYGMNIGTSGSVGSTLTATITGNTLTNNVLGIRARYGAVLTLRNNSIAGNSFGVNNTATGTVDAKNNWWGNASGPGGVGAGTGDGVSANVIYEPFCRTSACTGYALQEQPAGFGGGSSTNFSAITNYSSVDFILDNGVSVIVDFAVNSNVDLSTSSLLFSDYITMTTGYISVDSTGMPELNRLAMITFTGLNFSSTPTIYRDGVVCPGSICEVQSYNATTGTLIFLVTSFSAYYVVSPDIAVSISRLNYWNAENHTISVNWTGGNPANLSTAMPAGWSFVAGSGCTNPSGQLITCLNVANGSVVSFTMTVDNASAHPEFEMASLIINATSTSGNTQTPVLRLIRIQDQRIFHTLVEYGRGRGNYFFDTFAENSSGSGHTGTGCNYLPANSLLQLNYLHKVINIRPQYRLSDANAVDGSFTCTYPDNSVTRLHLDNQITDLGSLLRVDYVIPSIGGSWERMGYLGMDFGSSDYNVGDNITINCTDLIYSLPAAYGDIIVDDDAFTLEFRNKTPFQVSVADIGAQVCFNTTDVALVEYTITNTEEYPIDNVIIDIQAPEYGQFINVRGELWGVGMDQYRVEKINLDPGESETITLAVRFDTTTTPNSTSTIPLSQGVKVSYVPCWESNAYNPGEYLQWMYVNVNATVNSSQDCRSKNYDLINITVYINNTLTEIWNLTTYINNTLIELYNYTYSYDNNLSTIINNTINISRILEQFEFLDEVVFLVTDSVVAQREAQSALKDGDGAAAVERLTYAGDVLTKAITKLNEQQQAGSWTGFSTFKVGWWLPLLIIVMIVALALYLFARPPESERYDRYEEQRPR